MEGGGGGERYMVDLEFACKRELVSHIFQNMIGENGWRDRVDAGWAWRIHTFTCAIASQVTS